MFLLLDCPLSPLFFRNIIEMKDFALQAAILDECQIHLGGGEWLTSPTSINPDAYPLGTYEANMAAHTGNPPSWWSYEKIGDCKQTKLKLAVSTGLSVHP